MHWRWKRYQSTNFFESANLLVSSSLIRLKVYCPNLVSLEAGRQPSYLSAGMSTRWPSKLLKQSLVTRMSGPLCSMSLTHRSSDRGHSLPWCQAYLQEYRCFRQIRHTIIVSIEINYGLWKCYIKTKQLGHKCQCVWDFFFHGILGIILIVDCAHIRLMRITFIRKQASKSY